MSQIKRKANNSRRKLISLCAIFFLAVFSIFTSTHIYSAVDNKGTEFIVPFLPNFNQNATSIQLHLAADTATTVDIQYPMNEPTFITSVNVVPGDVSVVDLPLSADNWTSDTIADNAVLATSDDEFVAYMVNLLFQTSDAALALPVDTMNTDYIVASYPASFSIFGANSQLMVYAAIDGTEVTITPTVNAGSRPAGVPFTVSLDRGQSFYLDGNANGAAGDLSGTIIKASRPVGLINGNTCTQVPNGTVACDHIFEVAQPLQSWGRTAFVANLPNRPGGSIYRIYASADNTTVSLDGVELTTGLDRGQFFETEFLPGNHEFSADNPIFVTQFMPGQGSTGASTGDPAMGNMIPAEQYLNAYTFSTVGGSQFSSHFLTLIAEDSDIGAVLLDGNVIDSDNFSPIAGSGFSAAVLLLDEGVHTTSSPNGHGITVEGYNNFDSYIYPGGALFQFIDPTGDPWVPVCALIEEGDVYTGSVVDNVPSEDLNGNGILDPGEDTNNNGIVDADTGVFFIEASSIDNLDLSVEPFIRGDGQASFVLSLIDPGLGASATITATDGAGNTCESVLSIDPPNNEPMQCDFDADEDVDMHDIMIIRGARNTPAEEDDPRDIDGDGIITLNDARACVVQCTQNRCAVL